MSNSVSALSSGVSGYSPNVTDPPPKTSITQQMDTLASMGNSPQQIATDLGVTTSQVDATLGISTTTTTTPTTAPVAATGRLSVHA